jgi:uncharacterized protein YjbI with pentapeptide repeats
MMRRTSGETGISGRRRRVAFGLRWSRGSGAVAAFTVAVAALMGGSSALAATTTPRAAAPSYLFSIPTASGSLTGPDDHHLTLRLSGARDYLTRFTDRPLRQAFVVANVDFARRFRGYFASSAPNAVLTYTPSGAPVPVSIELTIRQPRWNAQHHTWTFLATRIRKRPDSLPGTTVHIKAPLIPDPRSFDQATLLIDDTVDGCDLQPGASCEGASLAHADLHGLDLSDIDFTGDDFTGADLTGANLTGATLTGATLTDANLVGATVTGTELSEANFTGANLHGLDLSNMDLYSANLSSTYLASANLTGANLNYAYMPGTNLTRANLSDATILGADLSDDSFIDANLTGVDLYDTAVGYGVNFYGATLCNTTFPDGNVYDSGC